MKKLKRILLGLKTKIKAKVLAIRYKKKHGFSFAELWNLDETMIELLYVRLKAFKEVCLTSEDYLIKYYDGRTVPWEDAVEELLDKIRLYWNLSRECVYASEEIEEAKEGIWFDWIQIQDHMWF